MRFILILTLLLLSFHLSQAIECTEQRKLALNLSEQFGPHLDQNDTGRCYAYASGKMIEAALYRSQGYKKHSIDPDILAADYYALATSSEMMTSLKDNLKSKSADLFSGGAHQDVLGLVANKKIQLFARADKSAPASQLKVCAENTQKTYASHANIKKAQSYLQACMKNLNLKFKTDSSAVQNSPTLSVINIYDAEQSGGCTDSTLRQVLDAVLCQSIPMITSLEVPYDPGDADNPHPINLFEVSTAQLKNLMSQTAENLDEKKYTRINTNMMKHAIIISGKINLGQTSYYILKNSQSAEFALLPEAEVCSLSRAQTLVTTQEAKSLKQALRKAMLNAELKKKSNRKPTSNK